MKFPDQLKIKIDQFFDGLSLSELEKERKNLTAFYQKRERNKNLDLLQSDLQRLAYLATRLPATYSVVYQVLKRVGNRLSGTLLDIGAGPGSVLLAAIELGIPFSKALLIERDVGFIRLGKELLSSSPVETTWLAQDFKKNNNLEPHDCVIASYSLNELTESEQLQMAHRLWELTKKNLIIIEPGTPAAFASLKQIRESLIQLGAQLIAPCPHMNQCPSDWCHFSQRIERSSLHRKTKSASLNYEDEKFSYLIFSKQEGSRCEARVIRTPYRGKGFIKFSLCTPTGMNEKIVTKKNKSFFSQAKKIEWGDELK